MKLSAIVLTRNEERNIAECLSSISFANELLVVDSGSTDLTVARAEKCGAKVLTHAFTDFASQRNFAMSQAQGDWILFIDADERVSPELAEEIKAVILSPVESEESARGQILRHEPAQDDEKQAMFVYSMPRHNYFFGRRLRFSDSREDAPIRLFPKTGVNWAQPVHEMIVTDLPALKLKSPLLHYGTRDLAHYRQKIRDYIPLEIETMRAKGVQPSLWKTILLPPAKFFQLYFVKFGLWDGIAGLQYAILSSYFYTLRKYWLYWKQR